jgi:hypothetical protein
LVGGKLMEKAGGEKRQVFGLARKRCGRLSGESRLPWRDEQGRPREFLSEKRVMFIMRKILTFYEIFVFEWVDDFSPDTGPTGSMAAGR